MRAPGIGTAETHAATRNRHCRGRLTRAVPLRPLNLRAFRKKAARAGIYASVVRVEFLTLSGPMVPTPFISPSMAGGCDAAGEPWPKLTGTGCNGRSEPPNDVKAVRRLRLTLRVAGTAKAGRAHHRHELAG